MTDLERALTPKPKARAAKSDKIWIGFSVNGDSAKVIKQALAKAGITNRGDYVRGLVLKDLNSKLGTAPKQ